MVGSIHPDAARHFHCVVLRTLAPGADTIRGHPGFVLHFYLGFPHSREAGENWNKTAGTVESMSTQWFTSDLHLGHPFVANLRGFDDVEQHDQRILDNLRNTVSPDDTLWVLGDCSSGWGPQEERALELLDKTFSDIRRKRNGEFSAHLIAGNHDSCHPMYTDSAASQRKFLRVFDSVQPFQFYEFDGQPAWLCHFPRPGFDHEGMDSRHDELRLDVGQLIHGHLHSNDPITGRGQIDVGVDAWDCKPVNEVDLRVALLKSFEKFPKEQ